MLRISPSYEGERIIQTNSFRIEPGGSESNVAIALANLGEEVTFLTKVPDNELNEIIFRYLRSFNVDTSYITKGNGRLGSYYTEIGIGPRPSAVIYDREGSSFSQIDFNEFNWDEISRKCSWFHTSGISPAVSGKSCEFIERVVSMLNPRVPISVDLNYRSKLWGWLENKAELKNRMLNICSKATLLMANETDLQDVFGYEASDTTLKEKYVSLASMAFRDMKSLQYIAVSSRNSISASRNVWSGILLSRDGDVYTGPQFEIDSVVDRVGSGDSFAAGIIYGMVNRLNPQYIIDFAVSLSALKHTVRGDASQFRKSDVEHILRTGSSGRIIR